MERRRRRVLQRGRRSAERDATGGDQRRAVARNVVKADVDVCYRAIDAEGVSQWLCTLRANLISAEVKLQTQ